MTPHATELAKQLCIPLSDKNECEPVHPQCPQFYLVFRLEGLGFHLSLRGNSQGGILQPRGRRRKHRHAWALIIHWRLFQVAAPYVGGGLGLRCLPETSGVAAYISGSGCITQQSCFGIVG